MGVPGFNVYFSEMYAKAYVPMSNVKVDHLYIDLNSVLHTVMRHARNHGHFHKLLHKRLNSILDVTEPTKSVMIAVDGPAPLAKLLTQRHRRKKNGRDLDAGVTLTGVAITPGTTFMLDLTHSLTYFCCTKVSSKRFRHLAFELSDGTVMGEGEVKVLGRLARPWYPEDTSDTHVILGDDADLILMALTSYKKNLFVANSSLSKGQLSKKTKVFSVNLLHQAWAGGFLAKAIAGAQRPPESALLSAKLDLTLIAILSKGNDYLPGLRGTSLEGSGGRSGLWHVYQSAAGKLRGEGGDAGPVLPGAISATGVVTSIDPATGAPRLDAAALAKLLYLHGVPGGAAGSDSEDEWRGSKAGADPQRYLHGCVWLLQMYITGQCPDYRFVYDGVAPSAAAVHATCEALVAGGQSYITLGTFGPADPRAALPLLPVVCALALLPASCTHLAAPCVRHLMQRPLSPSSLNIEAGAVAGSFDDELYYDLYGDCPQCLEMGAEMARANRDYVAARQACILTGRRLRSIQQGTAPVGEPSEEELAAQLEAEERNTRMLKSQMQSTEQRRKQHVASAHPYRRFPVEQLESVAASALATVSIGPAERSATQFGRPLVLRAFNNKHEAATFIRSLSARSPPLPQPSYRPPFGQQQHQQQQLRAASTWHTAHQQHQSLRSVDYDAIFAPPPPPFKVENPSFFASIVCQEVLYDEYGSSEQMQLRLASRTRYEVVQYFTDPAVDPKAAAAVTGGQREASVVAPVVRALAAAAKDPVELDIGAEDLGEEAAGVGVAVAAVGTAAATAVAEALAVLPEGGGGGGGESHKRSRAAAQQQQRKGGAVVAEAVAAAAAAPSSAKSRSRKPKAAKANKSGHPQAAASDVAAVAATVAAAMAVAAVEAAAAGPSAASAGPGPSAGAAMLDNIPPPMPSTRLLRNALASTAIGGAGGGARPGAPSASAIAPSVPPYRPLQFASSKPSTTYTQGHGQPAATAYGANSEGYGQYGMQPPQPSAARTSAPYDGGHSEPSPYYAPAGSQQYGVAQLYGAKRGHAPAPPYPAPVPVYGASGYGNSGAYGGPSLPALRYPVPPPYRPPSPPRAATVAAAAASAAAAAAGRGLVAPGPYGGRF